MNGAAPRQVVFCGVGTSGRSELARTIYSSSGNSRVERFSTHNVLVVENAAGILRISSDMWLSKLQVDEPDELFSDERVTFEMDALKQADAIVFLWDTRGFRRQANLNHLCLINEVLIRAVSPKPVPLLVLANIGLQPRTQAPESAILKEVKDLVTSSKCKSFFEPISFLLGEATSAIVAKQVITYVLEA